MRHEEYMQEAIRLAALAAANGDVPVGALVVKDGEVIGRGYNRREADQSAVAHAEILAIEEAARALGSWRLAGCTLYVTMEPCPMCAGAIVLARLDRLVFGVSDSRWGGAGSIFNIVEHPSASHRPEVFGGICESACREQVQSFFRQRRDEQSTGG